MPKRPRLALALLALAVAALALACAAYSHQHAPAAAAPAPAPAAEGAHPAPAPAGDGFAALSLDQQLAAVRGEVGATKRRLREAGKYDCCVMPACNQCLLKNGECHCRREVEDNHGPCCGECTEAWLEGRGMVKGVDPWELLERKKKQEAEQTAPEGEKPPRHDHHRHEL
jgi:hypothetical protein